LTDDRHGTRAARLPIDLLGGLYGRVTQARRAWYRAHAERRRRLHHPVISVGNLASGGSGKTPVVAALARLLLARGERPAVLTRGYGRRVHAEGVVVVSDGARVLAPVERSGDEAQLLAHALDGVAVLVCADRSLAGAFAERTFGTTVSLLDDGFQHVQLERDVDLVLVSPSDLREGVLPSGHLREPFAAARFADAVLVTGPAEDITAVARACGHESAFHVVPRYGPPQLKSRPLAGLPRCAIAVAGIARPERFFHALGSLGWNIARNLTYRDHHWYTARDIEDIARAAREAAADAVVTTGKDAVRLPGSIGGVPVLVLPMEVDIEPVGVFESWLLERLARARQASSPRGATLG